MKMTLRVALECAMAINKMPKLNSKSAYWVGRIKNALDSHGRQFERDRTALVKRMGVLNEENKQIAVGVEKLEEFTAALDALMDKSIVIQHAPIHVEALTTADGKQVDMAADVMAGLQPILTEHDAANA